MRLRTITLAFLLATTIVGTAQAQRVFSEPLPPEAQASFDKGVIAAKQQDYLLAIRYFQEARKVAPDAPELFYNLGLAESKIPGRELRSMAWFGAYLAADPNAPNAAAIKNAINELEVKSQSNIRHYIDALKVIAPTLRTENRGVAVDQIAFLCAAAGDGAEAERLLESEYRKKNFDDGGKLQRSYDYDHITDEAIRRGNLSEAKAWLAKLRRLDSARDSRLEEELAAAQTEAEKRLEDGKKMPTQERVNGWIKRLESNCCSSGYGGGYSGLDTPLFVDITGYLKALSEGVQPPGPDKFAQSGYPRSNDDPLKIFYNVYDTADEIIRVHNDMQRMMAEQSR